jgi:hypothetical protein
MKTFKQQQHFILVFMKIYIIFKQQQHFNFAHTMLKCTISLLLVYF